MSLDLHSKNLLTNGKSVKVIDLGRNYNFKNIEHKKEILDLVKTYVFITHRDRFSSPIYRQLLHFFNLNENDPVNFETYIQLLVGLSNNPYNFSTLRPEAKRKIVYEALMILAFIDGLRKAVVFGSKGIKFSFILTRIFHGLHDTDHDFKREIIYFTEFGKFLEYYTINYEVFVTEHTKNGTVVVVERMNTVLDEICRRLLPNLVSCSVETRMNPLDFYYRSYDSDVEEDTPPPPEEVDGGSNRRRRRRSRNSNKKRKYKSRKIRSRRKRK